MSTHPSFPALDRYALGEPDLEIARHLEGCARCRAHVDEVRADPGPLPAALRARAAPAKRSPRWAAALVALAAAALLVVGLEFVGPNEGAPYVAVKGEAALTVWIKRGDEVFPWAGGLVRPGDALRLEIDAPGAPRVVVRSQGRVLYEGPLGPDGLVPESWGVDDEGRTEVLEVEVIAGGETWREAVVLPKEAP